MDLETLIILLGGGASLLITLATVAIVLCSTGLIVEALVGGFGLLFRWIKKSEAEDKALNQAAQSWPSTTGTITKSRVEVQGHDYVNNVPVIHYEYEVNGTRHTNDEFFAGGLGQRYSKMGTMENPYDLVERYPVGMQVTVYYDPANPARSALER